MSNVHVYMASKKGYLIEHRKYKHVGLKVYVLNVITRPHTGWRISKLTLLGASYPGH